MFKITGKSYRMRDKI
ncbi:hypothetical protein LDA46_09950 [Enterococcus faecium]|nr:hypothetical protein [Enterococcus faecium]